MQPCCRWSDGLLHVDRSTQNCAQTLILPSGWEPIVLLLVLLLMICWMRIDGVLGVGFMEQSHGSFHEQRASCLKSQRSRLTSSIKDTVSFDHVMLFWNLFCSKSPVSTDSRLSMCGQKWQTQRLAGEEAHILHTIPTTTQPVSSLQLTRREFYCKTHLNCVYYPGEGAEFGQQYRIVLNIFGSCEVNRCA